MGVKTQRTPQRTEDDNLAGQFANAVSTVQGLRSSIRVIIARDIDLSASWHLWSVLENIKSIERKLLRTALACWSGPSDSRSDKQK